VILTVREFPTPAITHRTGGTLSILSPSHSTIAVTAVPHL